MANPSIDQQIRNTKIGILVSLIFFIAGILASAYLYVQLQQKKQEIEAQNVLVEQQRDSLEAQNSLISLYKDSLENTLASINKGFIAREDTALSRRINNLLLESTNLSADPKVAVFNDDRKTRALSLSKLLKEKRNDASTIREMIAFGKASIDDPKGTVNALYYLNANDSAALLPYRVELLRYLDLVDQQPGRQQAKQLSGAIRKKLR